MNKFVIFLLGVLVGIVCGTALFYCDRTPTIHINDIKTDTISHIEYKAVKDTIFIDKPKYYKEIIRDTVPINMYVENKSNYLIATQKEYRDSNYVAWISGVEPQLDSIMVFNNTEYVFKTATIETIKTIEDKTGQLFAGAGIYKVDNALVPKLNIGYQKNRIMVGAILCWYNKQPIYGVDINYKIK